jgi:DNA polymerase III alpha subunit
MGTIPLFTSAFSFKGILSLDPSSECRDGGADSIVKICEDYDIKTPFLIEENMAGFAQARKNFGDRDYSYGLRVTFCNDIEDKNKESESSNCKYVIFGDDTRLIKAFTKASVDGVYNNTPRLDFNVLKELWDDSMVLAVPFYDSFIFNNSFFFGNCIPDFSFCKPVFFIEDNGIFFDKYIREKVLKFVDENGYEKFDAKSIYYKNRSDYEAWLTYRCIQERATLEKPNFNHCMSKEFCLESWLEGEK